MRDQELADRSIFKKYSGSLRGLALFAMIFALLTTLPAQARSRKTITKDLQQRALADRALKKFVKVPTTKKFSAIVAHCRKKRFSAEVLRASARQLKESPTPLALRTLVKFRQYCSEGDFAINLDAWIGVDLLTQKPRLVLESLLTEKVNPLLLAELADANGPAGGNPFRGCGASCLSRIDAFYNRKAEAVRDPKLKGRGRQLQERMLNLIDASKEKWHRDFGS